MLCWTQPLEHVGARNATNLNWLEKAECKKCKQLEQISYIDMTGFVTSTSKLLRSIFRFTEQNDIFFRQIRSFRIKTRRINIVSLIFEPTSLNWIITLNVELIHLLSFTWCLIFKKCCTRFYCHFGDVQPTYRRW